MMECELQLIACEKGDFGMGKPNGIITLTTDFGNSDGFVGAMKGVILSINPNAQLVDIAHDIPHHDVRSAAWVLAGAFKYFPTGTVHLAVVDPGVGSNRKGLMAETQHGLFILPDNGLLSMVVKRDPLIRAHSLDNPQYQLPVKSNTFHGRDIFAPAAAHASLGVPVPSFGQSVDSLVEQHWPSWRKHAGQFFGNILSFDAYGNAITNLPNHLVATETWRCSVGGYSLLGPIRSYADAEIGKPLFLPGSMDLLEIAVREGSARDRLELALGMEVTLEKIKTPL